MINHCENQLQAVVARRNDIVKRIREAAAGWWQIDQENQLVRRAGLKLDLFLVEGKDALNIDVTCLYEGDPDIPKTARNNKIVK